MAGRNSGKESLVHLKGRRHGPEWRAVVRGGKVVNHRGQSSAEGGIRPVPLTIVAKKQFIKKLVEEGQRSQEVRKES